MGTPSGVGGTVTHLPRESEERNPGVFYKSDPIKSTRACIIDGGPRRPEHARAPDAGAEVRARADDPPARSGPTEMGG